MNVIQSAAIFAEEAHKGQTRRYTGDPYIVHPMRVAGMLTMHPDANEDIIAAAWLHDVVEDTDVTIEQILERFGYRVADLVQSVTKPDTPEYNALPRHERKRIINQRLEHAPRGAKMIKLADRIDNLRGFQNPNATRDFVKLYIRESYDLSRVLMDADAWLYSQLFKLMMDMKEEYDA